MKFKSGDQVIITAGKDKGKTGEITKVFPKSGKVTVKGVNLFKRHVKPRDGIEGQIITLERPLTISNIAIVDPIDKKPTRIGYQLIKGGGKIRIAKRSGADLDKKTETKTKKSKTTKKAKTKKK